MDEVLWGPRKKEKKKYELIGFFLNFVHCFVQTYNLSANKTFIIFKVELFEVYMAEKTVKT